jgi:hypothetical protein
MFCRLLSHQEAVFFARYLATPVKKLCYQHEKGVLCFQLHSLLRSFSLEMSMLLQRFFAMPESGT